MTRYTIVVNHAVSNYLRALLPNYFSNPMLIAFAKQVQGAGISVVKAIEQWLESKSSTPDEAQRKLDILNYIMDHARPEYTSEFRTISFQSLGCKVPLRVYLSEDPAEPRTRGDLGSLYMVLQGNIPEY